MAGRQGEHGSRPGGTNTAGRQRIIFTCSQLFPKRVDEQEHTKIAYERIYFADPAKPNTKPSKEWFSGCISRILSYAFKNSCRRTTKRAKSKETWPV